MSEQPPLIIVVGLDRLGLATIERLVESGVRVHAMGRAREAGDCTEELAKLGVPLVVGAARIPQELAAAGLASAAALVLTDDDDSDNVDAALAARRLRPDLPLVVRVFDAALVEYLRETLDRLVVLSMSSESAPVFVELATRALGARKGVAPAAAPAARPRSARARRLDRVLALAGLSLVTITLLATAYFARALDLPWIDALYFVWTTISTVGYGDVTPRHASTAAKLASMALMTTGAALITVLYAFLSGWVLERRLDVLRGRVAARESGHVVLIGAGSVGVRVAQALSQAGREIVVVERDPACRHVEGLRALGHHVILADATVESALDLAAVDRAAAVLALTDADAVNLLVLLLLRRRAPGVPVVLRLNSRELSTHVTARGEALAASPIEISSLRFAKAALTACGRAAS